MTDTTATLTPTQQHALFDILTHHETYKEIEDFKYPGAIKAYGPPFQDNLKQSDAPILQTLLSKFILRLPGLRDVSPEFWKTRVADLIEELSQAELSESYDKGLLGVRKTLATAISALIEYPARGSLAGVPKRDKGAKKEYDVSNPEDVMGSWHDALQEATYGSFVDEMFAKAAETDDLSKHPSLVQAMHEFVVVNLASLMHYTLVLSPEGPTILRMISTVHSMLPYTIMRQTLKIGNVASMLSAMMKVILAKASLSTVTNWMGLTTGADEGMNLLQQIITQVLNWDKRELKKRADKIEKDKAGPPKQVLSEITSWITQRSRVEHEECRRQSREQRMSIVAIIMATSSQSIDELKDAQHAQALEYLTLQLGIRDRQEIVRVLCQRNPDHLTAGVRDGVDAYTPMIRYVHQAVNLSDTVWDFEQFLTDMLKMSKPSGPKGKEKPPSVEDYVDLLHRHQQSCHKFLHQVAKNGKEVVAWWKDYVHMAAAEFKEKPNGPDKAIVSAFGKLKASEQNDVKAELDVWSKYLDDLHSASATRIASIITRSGSTPFGPGAYLARWQHLLDTTIITPEKQRGPVRYGGSKSVKEESREGVNGDEADEFAQPKVAASQAARQLDAPEVDKTIGLLGAKFREIIAGG
ncbi:hypothetical protein LTR56_009645 [Elasticomyces elasticus]|nr:hypothetical protein LTR56_009645 [Elasticomyces elasticus]KAK3660145.1 hypothetical protein LTR22_008152 [Elasticomyces elasticus]KAK4923450.1 hypothetical protein LTR49_009324 [Elasticomyces elasticus]KAK5752322.1 hypothetical protein LTS12_017623 [Elasticomyces elasticus]